MSHLHLNQIGAPTHFQAQFDGSDLVFSVRRTTEGWKTEGHPVFDGRLWTSQQALVADL